jgi:murein DD-endopeptidase MepM/ murein hydrolase activator NlpD
MTNVFPQIDATKANPTMGGWGYLDDNGASCFHPGIDFNSHQGGNADCGAPVVAITDQTLVAHIVDLTGFGLHQWWRLDAGPYAGAYVHYCHLSDATYTEIGTTAKRTQPIAAVGRSGGWEYCHLHFEVSREQPPHWRYWPKGQAREAVAAQYHDPIIVAHAYDAWAETHQEADVTPELKAIAEALTETGYPASEVPDLLRAVKAWSANSASLAGWIEEIGALKARVAELEAVAPPAEASAGVA